MGRKNSGRKSINKKNIRIAGIVILLGFFLAIALLKKRTAADSEIQINRRLS